MREGYLVLALDQQKYLEMARVLALSIKRTDRTRPVGLICNDGIETSDQDLSVFDEIVYLPRDVEFVGVMNRFRIFGCAPFGRNMVVDADCVMVKPNVDYYWQMFRGHSFNMLGNKAVSGNLCGHDVKKICKRFDLPFVVAGNAGTFYFEVSAEGKKVFSHMKMLCMKHKQDLSGIHQKRKGQYATEPIIGATMGAFGIEPLAVNMEVGSLMVSTWRARNCHFDLVQGISYIEKPRGFHFNIPLPVFAKGWVPHSPIFAHFIDLKPTEVYRCVVRQVMAP